MFRGGINRRRRFEHLEGCCRKKKEARLRGGLLMDLLAFLFPRLKKNIHSTLSFDTLIGGNWEGGSSSLCPLNVSFGNPRFPRRGINRTH